jgi:hypothetical protein
MFAASVVRLEALRKAYDDAYGKGYDNAKTMRLLPQAQGSLTELIRLAADAAHNVAPLRKHRHAA